MQGRAISETETNRGAIWLAHFTQNPQEIRELSPSCLVFYHKYVKTARRKVTKYIEAIERADIDTYKIKRSTEKSLRHDRLITPRTINFEVSTLRTFFYYLENERGLKLKNHCTKLKPLKDQKKKAKSNPPVYNGDYRGSIFPH